LSQVNRKLLQKAGAAKTTNRHLHVAQQITGLCISEFVGFAFVK